MTSAAHPEVRYRFRAARPDGRTVTGLIEAGGAAEAGQRIRDRGLHPIVIEPADPYEGRRRSGRRRDLALLFRSLSALVMAGLPLDRALAASEEIASGPLKDVVMEAGRRLREGDGLASALAAGRGMVPPVVIGMLSAGERSGQLGAALESVAAHLEREAELVARIRQALAYPLLVAGVGTISVLVIATVIVPRFAALLGDLGQRLPPATRLLLAASDLLVHRWPLLLAVVAVASAVTYTWMATPAGHQTTDRLLLACPVIGGIRARLATARFSHALAGMLRAGMPLLPALDAARDAAGDTAIGSRVADARERVAEGGRLAAAMKQTRALTPLAVRLYHVGESSGSLPELVARAGDLASAEADRTLQSAITLIEPALVVVFGGLVAFVAAALLQAVYSIRPAG